MRSHKEDRKQRGKSENEDGSARLVPNLSSFRSPICHYFDLISMGMHPKFCRLPSLPGYSSAVPTWNPCLVRGERFCFLGVEATSTGLTFDAMSTGAIRCRHEQCFVDRSHVASTEAILEDVPAVVCRQEQCRQEQKQYTGALFYRQEQSWRPFQQLERPEKPDWAAWGPIWAAWKPGKPVWARLTWPQGGV